jgi:hypothetical protein
MFNTADENFSKKEWVAILFKEYDTLRAEVLSRSNSHHQLVAVTATLIAATLAFSVSKIDFTQGFLNANVYVMVGISLALATAATTALMIARRNTRALGSRIAVLEVRINELAGSDLLSWESNYGSGTKGWFRLSKN